MLSTVLSSSRERQALREWERELEDKESKLEKGKTDLERDLRKLKRGEKTVAKREKAVAKRERAVAEREKALAAQDKRGESMEADVGEGIKSLGIEDKEEFVDDEEIPSGRRRRVNK